MKAYCFDETGRYTGEVECQESPLEPGTFLMPAYSTTRKPQEIVAGYYPKWNNHVWRAEAESVEILPEPVIDRRSEILRELSAIDSRTTRAVRELTLDPNSIASRDILNNLELGAAILRAELVGL